MTRNGFIHSVAGLVFAAALFALPATAAAQASTFVLSFDRTGTPGAELKPVLDPITGLPLLDPSGQPVMLVTQTGAFVNPCTGENVDVIGSTTLTIFTNITGSGSMKISVGEVTKGNGLGQMSGFTYSFSDSQQFNSQFAVSSDPTTLTETTFSDKLFLRGAKSVDNWTIRATFKVQVNGNGVVTSVTENLTGDVCKG
jgi:hypothetical protein